MSFPWTVRLAAPVVVSLLAVPLLHAEALGAKQSKPGKKGRGVITRTALGTAAGHHAILSATASCPKRARAIGGGFSLPAPAPGVNSIIFESQKVGQRSWRATGQLSQAAPFDPVTIRAEVYCRRGAPKTKTVASTVPTPNAAPLHEEGPATSAACPSKRRLIGGGFATTPPLGSFGARNVVRRSEPTGNSWTSEVESDNAEGTLTSYAYCAKRKPASPLGVASSTVPGVNPAPPVTSVAATCARKRTAVGGGFRQSYDLMAGGGAFLPYESRRAGKSWSVVADQGGDSTAISLTAAAVCAPKKPRR
jgi:hypothetical protein